MKTKQYFLLVAMMGVLFATAFAGNPDETNKKRSELMKERYEYFKNNIKPKVDAERNKLETTISEADKKEITRLREEIMKQKLMENEFLAEAKAGIIKGEPFNEGLWMELNAQKIVIENLYDQAKLIANKYRPQIDDMLTDLRASLRDVSETNRPDRGQMDGQRGQKDNRGNGQGAHRFGEGDGGRFGHRGPGELGYGFNGGFGPGINRGLDMVSFLLWDVNRG
jgi:cytochrome c556